VASVHTAGRSLSGDVAAALKSWADSGPSIRSSEQHSIGLRLDNVTCMITGGQALTCRATYSNGTTEEFEMAALADGHTWVVV
jgi:hypothetical protein